MSLRRQVSLAYTQPFCLAHLYQEIKTTQDQLRERAASTNSISNFRAEMDDLILKAYDAFEKCVQGIRLSEGG